ncbi:MAG: hypothetical protein U1F43_20955 [Myxococcota bacterium]
MRRGLGCRWGWALVVGVLAAGCGKADEEQPYETPTFPPPPPKEMRLDKPTGAILSKPAPEWQWLEGAALKALDPDAALGLRRDERCEGWVAVTPAGEPSPRSAALRLLAGRQAEATWDVHVDEDLLYLGHTARRWEIQRRNGDAWVSERTSVLVEGPRLYALHARSRDTDYGRRRRCLDALTAALDVMMYQPPRAPEVPPPADASDAQAAPPSGDAAP